MPQIQIRKTEVFKISKNKKRRKPAARHIKQKEGIFWTNAKPEEIRINIPKTTSKGCGRCALRHSAHRETAAVLQATTPSKDSATKPAQCSAARSKFPCKRSKADAIYGMRGGSPQPQAPQARTADSGIRKAVRVRRSRRAHRTKTTPQERKTHTLRKRKAPEIPQAGRRDMRKIQTLCRQTPA